MIFRNRLRARTMIRIGLVCFALATLATRFLHPSAALPGGVIDAAGGFLYGISIVFLLWGALASRRGSR